MEMMLHALSWAEIPVADFVRARKFYNTIFDYEMPDMQMGPNRMGFLLFDQQNKGVGAAIVQGDGYVPGKTGIKLYLSGGNDLSVVLDRVEKAGGKIISPKMKLSPELGAFAFFEDCEGNVLGLHSPN